MNDNLLIATALLVAGGVALYFIADKKDDYSYTTYYKAIFGAILLIILGLLLAFDLINWL